MNQVGEGSPEEGKKTGRWPKRPSRAVPGLRRVARSHPACGNISSGWPGDQPPHGKRGTGLANEEPVEGGAAAEKQGEGSADGESMGAAAGDGVRKLAAVLESWGTTAVLETWGPAAGVEAWRNAVVM